MKRLAEVKMMTPFEGLPIRPQFQKSDLHLMRKVWHLVMGLIIVFFYVAGTTQAHAILILGGFLAFALLLETTRLKNRAVNEKVLKFCGLLMRSHEERQMSTVIQYLASVILAIAIFPKTVAVLSILYLACGDPIASTFGILFGHHGPKWADGRTLIGTLAGVLVCTMVTFFYLNNLSHSVGSVVFLSIAGGMAGGLAELFPFKIDDNFTIPIISGFILWFIFMIIGI